ncbi:MAG: hypothetical protein LBO20_02050 [Bifidobacteriaceae bacterium]|jgi:hypothetical protein|nr:hypothetical protein [Bifidobacteriaceae bacterium]
MSQDIGDGSAGVRLVFGGRAIAYALRWRRFGWCSAGVRLVFDRDASGCLGVSAASRPLRA